MQNRCKPYQEARVIWDTLQVDAVIITFSADVRQSLIQYNRRHPQEGKKFVTKKIKEGYKIWREK